MADPRKSYAKSGAQGAAAAPAKAVEAPVFTPEAKGENSRKPRIAELRKRVQAGTYKVDAAKVSAKIVDDHLS